MQSRRRFLSAIASLVAAAGLSQLAGGAEAVAPVRKGIPGRTYFRCSEHYPPDGYRVYLDGRDVHCEASECDLAAGWARLHRTTGERGKWGPVFANPPRQYVAWGKVELRPKAPSPESIAQLERIPPLLVKFTKALEAM